MTSVSWTQRGTHLAVGTNKGEVQIWDATHCRRLRTMSGTFYTNVTYTRVLFTVDTKKCLLVYYLFYRS